MRFKELTREEAEETLRSIAVKFGVQFLKSEDVPKEEEELAFAGYCCGFIDGFKEGVKAANAVEAIRKQEETGEQ